MRQQLVEDRKRVKLDDVCAKPLVFNLQSAVVKNHEFRKHLWLMGVDLNGFSVVVKVADFHPTILLQSPESWSPQDHDAQEDLNDLKDELNERTSSRSNTERIVDAEFVYMSPFIGFTNRRQDRLIKLHLASLSDVAPVVKTLKEDPQSKFVLFHDDMDPVNQFLQQKKIALQEWLVLDRVRYHTASRQTHCNLEGWCNMKDIQKTSEDHGIPVILKCFLRLKAVSRDGVVTEQYSFRPDDKLPFDRIVSIGVSFLWSDVTTGVPVCEKLYTIIPNESFPPGPAQHYETEGRMLEAFQSDFVSFDPDDLFFYPDEFHPLSYYCTRAQESKVATQLDRFKDVHMRSFHPVNASVPTVTLDTRNLFNMENCVQKKVFISVESYDLITVSCHPDFRKGPKDAKGKKLPAVYKHELITDKPNALFHRGIEGRRRLLEMTMQDLRLMYLLERDTSMRIEYSNISAASDTNLTAVVCRGEQIRVYNLLTRVCGEQGMYLNKAKLSQKPLKFRISERKPTLCDPPELEINTTLRQKCITELERKLALRDSKSMIRKKKKKPIESPSLPRASDDEKKEAAPEAEEDEAEGGNVMHPSCAYWGDERIFVFDFKSLYPSIMMGYNISYENIVFDPEYMDLPGVNYMYVAVNKYETIALVNMPGVIPKMLRMLVDKRDAIKKVMKKEKDDFKKNILDFAQNSMKVLCNATYGFCGAEKGGMLAVKAVCLSVCSIGRFLQKFCANYIGTKYGVPTIYGDTDSIFVKLIIELGDTIEMVCEKMGKRYEMDQFLGEPFTWAAVVKRYAQKSLDITSFSFQHQVNCICYLVADKVCEEMTHAIGQPPVELNHENMATQVWMDRKKKFYCYNFWEEGNPSKIAKIKVTGMSSKKREYAPFVRQLLKGVTELLLTGRENEVETFIKDNLSKLISGKVPLRELTISKGYKNKNAYKHYRQIHLQVVLKLEQRTRWPVKEKSRVYLVIIKGNDQLYLRSETPEFAEERGLSLDISYYLENQIYKPMRKLLQYHPHLFDFEQLYRQCQDTLSNMKNHQSSTGVAGSNHRRLTLAEFTAQKRIKR